MRKRLFSSQWCCPIHSRPPSVRTYYIVTGCDILQAMEARAVRIAMLNADIPVPNVRARLGTYGAIFHRLLVEAASRISLGSVIESTDFDVVQGEYPEDLSNFDAMIISGSAAAAYDDASWVRKLDAYILSVYQDHPRIRIFGSCFGHQLICQSLFRNHGVLVEKDPKGWELGVHKIQFTEKFSAALGPSLKPKGLLLGKRPLTPSTETGRDADGLRSSEALRLQFVHADHVKIPHGDTLPPPWMVIGSSKHCAVQGIYEPGRVLTLQGHFEFDRFVNSETINVFGASWAPERLAKALHDMDADDDADKAAEMVARFLAGQNYDQENYNCRTGLITPPVEVS
jgi:GMP synthase-like glutamine amidotransferase